MQKLEGENTTDPFRPGEPRCPKELESEEMSGCEERG